MKKLRDLLGILLNFTESLQRSSSSKGTRERGKSRFEEPVKGKVDEEVWQKELNKPIVNLFK